MPKTSRDLILSVKIRDFFGGNQNAKRLRIFPATSSRGRTLLTPFAIRYCCGAPWPTKQTSGSRTSQVSFMSISNASTAIYAAKPRRHFSRAMMKAAIPSFTNSRRPKTRSLSVWKPSKAAQSKPLATTETNKSQVKSHFKASFRFEANEAFYWLYELVNRNVIFP